MDEVKSKCRKAAISFLERRGGEVLDDDLDGYIVYKDGDFISIVDVMINENEEFIDDVHIMREDFEGLVFKFFKNQHENYNTGIRFDVIEVVLLDDHRALLQYRKNEKVI